MSSKTQSRGSSLKVSSRPKLMRAHATAPSLATSNASRKDLANLQSSSKAASILSRVASYSAQQGQDHGGASPRSVNNAYSTPGNRSLRSPRSPESGLARSCKEELKGMQAQYQSGYFSFPSFEDFQGYQEPTERMERKSVS